MNNNTPPMNEEIMNSLIDRTLGMYKLENEDLIIINIQFIINQITNEYSNKYKIDKQELRKLIIKKSKLY